jgi:hypothetical protein
MAQRASRYTHRKTADAPEQLAKYPDSAVDSAQASDTPDLSPGQTSLRHSLTTPASHPAGSCVIGERQCPIQEDAHVRASDTHHTIRP